MSNRSPEHSSSMPVEFGEQNEPDGPEGIDPEDCGIHLIPAQLMRKFGHDKFDPLSSEILAQKDKLDELRAGLVRAIKANMGDMATSDSPKLIEEARAAALQAHTALRDMFNRKEEEDATREIFDEGKCFTATVLHVMNLPKVDKFGACDAYCTFNYEMTSKLHPPMSDGNKTYCERCEHLNAFAKASCKHHRSDVAAKSYDPVFNRSFKFKLDQSKSQLLIAVYNWNRSGGHPLIGWFRVPVWAVLYTKVGARMCDFHAFCRCWCVCICVCLLEGQTVCYQKNVSGKRSELAFSVPR